MREALRARLLSSGTLLPTMFGRTVFRRVSGTARSVFVTFDDGPGKGTRRLLEYLRDASIPATFFLTGERVGRYTEEVKIIRDQHGIGNHFFNHRDPWLMRSATMKESVEKTDSAISDATGSIPHLVRPPFGHIRFSLLRHAMKTNKRVCLWDIMPGDFQRGFDPVLSAVACQKMARAGSVIVLHDHGIDHTERRLIPFLETLRVAMEDDGFRFDRL